VKSAWNLCIFVSPDSVVDIGPAAPGRGQGHMSGRQQRETPKWGAVIFLRYEVYEKSVSSVEAGIGMEGQVICIEQCTFWMSSVAFLGPQNAPKSLAAGASPQTSLGRLQRSPDPKAVLKGPTSNLRAILLRRRKGGGGSAKMIFAPVARNPTASAHSRWFN